MNIKFRKAEIYLLLINRRYAIQDANMARPVFSSVHAAFKTNLFDDKCQVKSYIIYKDNTYCIYEIYVRYIFYFTLYIILYIIYYILHYILLYRLYVTSYTLHIIHYILCTIYTHTIHTHTIHTHTIHTHTIHTHTLHTHTIYICTIYTYVILYLYSCIYAHIFV